MQIPRRPVATTTSGSVLPRPANVSFYLPQFHPIAENDLAWGAGFTEWHNVVMARPRFRGHRQPVLPGELGFYDLRLDQTRQAQMELAGVHGVHAFCWYHYWFTGRRLLHEPFDQMRRDASEKLPFMLCWANEPWTRLWSGKSGSIIVEQHYSMTDDENHIQYLLDVFADPRYVCIDDKPVFLVYQPTDLPDIRRTIELWRIAAERAGFPGLVILGVESFRHRHIEPVRLGLDGVVEQQPDLRVVRPFWRAAPRVIASKTGFVQRYPPLVRVPYERVASRALHRLRLSHDPSRYSTVCPGWDNSPRRARGAVVLTGSTAKMYESWLEQTLLATDAPLVFVNAWNEWAEGAHLEPDREQGTSYLEAHRRAVDRTSEARRVT